LAGGLRLPRDQHRRRHVGLSRCAARRPRQGRGPTGRRRELAAGAFLGTPADWPGWAPAARVCRLAPRRRPHQQPECRPSDGRGSRVARRATGKARSVRAAARGSSTNGQGFRRGSQAGRRGNGRIGAYCAGGMRAAPRVIDRAAGVVRPGLRALQTAFHRPAPASELAAYGLTPDQVIDFSVSTNPLGPAPSVLRALQSTNWSRYPGDDELPLRRALAERAAVDVESVVLGNGSAELIWLVALACLQSGDRAAVGRPAVVRS